MSKGGPVVAKVFFEEGYRSPEQGDPLTQAEALKIARAIARLPELLRKS